MEAKFEIRPVVAPCEPPFKDVFAIYQLIDNFEQKWVADAPTKAMAEVIVKALTPVSSVFLHLPDMCYDVLPSSGLITVLTRGESGYRNYPEDFGDRAANIKAVIEFNAELKVTEGQRQAMSCGSMFGWESAGANPANYNEAGKWCPVPVTDEPVKICIEVRGGVVTQVTGKITERVQCYMVDHDNLAATFNRALAMMDSEDVEHGTIGVSDVTEYVLKCITDHLNNGC